MESLNESKWKDVIKIGAIAALVAAILFRRWLSVEVSLFASFNISGLPTTTPVTILDWFSLLQSNRIIGLIQLNVLDFINYALVGLIFLSLYVVLKKSSTGAATLALLMTFTGIGIYFACNQSFSILALADKYSMAISDAQKATFLAAGEALLIQNDPLVFGNGVFWAFMLVNGAGLIYAIAMLKSPIFTKLMAVMGIIANGSGLFYFFTVLIKPELTFIPLSLSAPFLLVWYILIGVRFLKLSAKMSNNHPKVEK